MIAWRTAGKTLPPDMLGVDIATPSERLQPSDGLLLASGMPCPASDARRTSHGLRRGHKAAQRRQVCVQGTVDQFHLIQRAAQTMLGGCAMQVSNEGDGGGMARGNGFPTVGAWTRTAFGTRTAFEQNQFVHRKIILSGGRGPVGVRALAGLSLWLAE
jgi:hypothetical protein